MAGIRFGWIILTALLLSVFAGTAKAQTFLATNGDVSFFSKAPLENIDAHSKQMSGVIKAETREVAFSVPIKSFRFRKALMQEHFNEKFMESDKFPKATFTGIITENVDLSQPGSYAVSVEGDLTIHGVTQKRNIAGTVVSDGNNLQLATGFQVKVADHQIRIPKLVFESIAEVIAVKLEMTLIKQ